jgi:iron complex transport system substrate-binding protein
MKNLNLAFTIFLVSLFTACDKPKSNTENKTANSKTTCNITYAKGFKIEHYVDYTKIVVRNPWDTTQTLETYILIDRNKAIPKKLPQGSIVRVPVKRVATCSAIFAGEYKQLCDIRKIVAVSEPEYVYIPEITKGVANGKITNLGINTSLNAEKLIASKTDILVVSPFEESMHDRFKKVGVCVVKDASYMEESPLGRTEWIKFEAAFLSKDSLADAIFSSVEKRYNDICAKVKATKNRPTVFNEKKTGDTWYVAGGKSYMGNFLKDAGAEYIWKDMKNTGSLPFSFEKVFAKAINAQFWMIKYNNTQSNLTLAQLGDEYDLYKNFAAYKAGNVFAVNSGITRFYEEAPLEPDVVLSDLVSIFHPEILPGYKPKYYFKLK